MKISVYNMNAQELGSNRCLKIFSATRNSAKFKVRSQVSIHLVRLHQCFIIICMFGKIAGAKRSWAQLYFKQV